MTIIRQYAACTALLAGSIGFAGCSGDFADHEQTVAECPDPEFVCIRVENSSDLDFESFRVSFDGQTESYGPLAAGGTSDYRRIGAAYRYAYTEAVSGQRRYILQPIDFVGERHLPPGAYTYRYTASILDEPTVRDDWRLDGYLSVRLIVVDEDTE